MAGWSGYGSGSANSTYANRREPGAPRYPSAALPVLVHGDAAFPGEGIAAETLNLSRLPGYATGGTVHIVVDNLLGFTAEPRDTRSTRFASDLAKGFEVPVVHVNADDPEACLHAAHLALDFRQRFHADVAGRVVRGESRADNERELRLKVTRIGPAMSLSRGNCDRNSRRSASSSATARRRFGRLRRASSQRRMSASRRVMSDSSWAMRSWVGE